MVQVVLPDYAMEARFFMDRRMGLVSSRHYQQVTSGRGLALTFVMSVDSAMLSQLSKGQAGLHHGLLTVRPYLG